jgi:4-hydroxy-tetrahydrodipicolinate synthase
VNPAAIHRLYAEWQSNSADDQQKALNVVRDAFSKKYVMIPALKQAIAHFSDDPQWAMVRPPLDPLTKEQAAAFVADLTQIGFTMPGLKEARAPTAA